MTPEEFNRGWWAAMRAGNERAAWLRKMQQEAQIEPRVIPQHEPEVLQARENQG